MRLQLPSRTQPRERNKPQVARLDDLLEIQLDLTLTRREPIQTHKGHTRPKPGRKRPNGQREQLELVELHHHKPTNRNRAHRTRVEIDQHLLRARERRH